MNDHRRHLFVSGPQRSGTTLLRLVLSAHPEITVTPEAQFLRDLFRRGWSGDHLLEPAEMLEIEAWLAEDFKLAEWPGFELERFWRDLVEGRAHTVASLLEGLFLAFARSNGGGTTYLGNKKGFYSSIKQVVATRKVFGDARFIYTVRDPRDAIRSVRKNLPARELDKAIKVCLRRGRYIRELSQSYPADVHVVRYEDLVSSPREACRKMCQFLEVPFHEAMLAFHDRNSGGELLLPGTLGIHRNTTTPFNPELIGQWRRDDCLSPADLRLIERSMQDFFAFFGYEPSLG